jgi:hypothetical protein
MMAKLRLRDHRPDLPPSGRWIRQRVLVPGDPRASKVVEVQLGARPDRRDWNPARCAAKRKRIGDQCGRLPVRGRAVCAMHGVPAPIRQRSGERLAPELSGALGSLVRDHKRGTVHLTQLATFFPRLAERVARYTANPALLDLQRDAAVLTALRDELVEGELVVDDAQTIVTQITRVTDSKAAVLRAKSVIDQVHAVPVERVNELVQNLVLLLQKYSTPEREQELFRDLRLLGARIDTPTGRDLSTEPPR